MYFNSKNKENCCGCKACESICPTNAITFIEDYEGFWYPEINNDICIKCKKCENVCKFNSVQPLKTYEVYAAWNIDSNLRDKSSSGGIFLPLSKYIIKNGGLVFGAAYDSDFYVKHIAVDSLSDISKLQKSKYVQSDTNGIFTAVKEQLKIGRTVLFSGTPCQIAALTYFLNKKYENLILCEVLCFGVPSPKVYKKYLEYNQKTYKSAISSIDFKDKRYGWDYYTTALQFSNGKTVCKFGGDSYRTFMGRGLSLRPSCLSCNYDVNHSYADISLGDFYNVANYVAEKPPKNGVSCVMVRTPKGEMLFNEVKKCFVLHSIDYVDFSKKEIRNLKKPDRKERAEFFAKINDNKYLECIKFIKNKNICYKLKSKIIAFKKRFFYEA